MYLKDITISITINPKQFDPFKELPSLLPYPTRRNTLFTINLKITFLLRNKLYHKPDRQENLCHQAICITAFAFWMYPHPACQDCRCWIVWHDVDCSVMGGIGGPHPPFDDIRKGRRDAVRACEMFFYQLSTAASVQYSRVDSRLSFLCLFFWRGTGCSFY